MSDSIEVIQIAFDTLILITITLMFGWLSDLEKKIRLVTKGRET